MTNWIPVTERLPDIFVNVLCTNGRSVFKAYYYDGSITKIMGWWECPDDGHLLEDITHWMPLPKLPKKEKMSI